MQLQFRNAESSLHWHSNKFVPFFYQWIHTSQCTRGEQPQHSSCTLCPGLCLSPSRRHSKGHPQQRKRSQATWSGHFPFLPFMSAAMPRYVTVLGNLYSVVLFWRKWNKIWTEMDTQLRGVSGSLITGAAMLGSAPWPLREDIFELLPQHGVLPPQRTNK